MAKNGYLIFDSDTHVGPDMDIMERYLSTAEKQLLEPLAQYKRGTRYYMGERKYDRKLGEAEPKPADPSAYMGGRFTGAKRDRFPDRNGDYDPAARLADLDFEGVDVNLMLPSGWFGCFTAQPGIEVESAMYRAYNRWMAEYCAAAPDRLGGVILLSGRDVQAGLAELEAHGKEPWAWGVFAYAPYGMPLDHPDLEPYWQKCEELDLAVTLHTFTVMPPYAPGGLDNWDNLWLQRASAHPWCGMRNMASLVGSGLFDRYPTLHLGVLEAGHGWLPGWVKRLDEHTHSVAAAIPQLQALPSEYVTNGRYFQSIEMGEGQAVTQAVIDILGDHVLMYASDYPHGESWFPHSVETVMAWEMDPAQKRKLFWDNAVKYYKRYQPSAALLAQAQTPATV